MVSRSKRRRLAKERQGRPKAPVTATPAVQPRRRRRRGNTAASNLQANSGVARSSGVDVIYTASVGDNMAVGHMLWLSPLNPRAIKGTRLHSESKLWARWRPRNLSLRIVGTGSTATGGAVLLAWTPDVRAIVSGDNFTNINILSAFERSSIVRLDSSGELRLPTDTKYRWYGITESQDDIESNSHGRFYIAVVSPPTNFKGSISIIVELKWDVEFEGRRIVDLVLGPHGITPNATAIFTTSDSSFDSTILTFKEKSGGSMVEFPGALPGVVYRVFNSVRIPIKLSGGGEGEATVFTRVQGHPTAGLVMHATTEHAISYIKTGSRVYCLKYYGAGGYATPSRPTFLADPEYLDAVRSSTPDLDEVMDGFEDLGIS